MDGTREWRLQRWIPAGWRVALAFAAALAVIRVVYGYLGLRFDVSTLPTFMQFIDPELLSSRFAESVWYSHAHPPLLNVFAGIGLKLFGEHAAWFYAATFHVLGLVLVLSVFELTRRLTGSRAAGYCAGGVLLLNPAFVLYENWLMYTFPAATLVAASTVALLRYLDDRRTARAVLFFSLLAILALTRNLFHLIWVLTVVALLVAVLKAHRRQLLLAAVAPVLVVALWYGKNYVYYGTFSGSTMLGLGLSNITSLTVPREDLLPLVERGELSPLVLVSRYTEMPVLMGGEDSTPPSGIPVLDTVQKSTGHYNYNTRRLIEINRIYARDALGVARAFPFNYVVGVFIANRLFFSPSYMNEYFPEENLAATSGIAVLYNFLYGAHADARYMVQPHFGFDGPPSLEVNTGLGLIFAWLLVLPYCYVRARRAWLPGKAGDLRSAIVIGFMLVTIVYVYLTSTLLELGENQRYRFMIEPVFIVLAAVALVDLVRAIGRRLSAPASADRRRVVGAESSRTA